MKYRIITYFFLISFFQSNIYSQEFMTRGPDVGEIYFLGPTNTFKGLYYSSDFGESAVCTDDITNIHSIAADLTAGGIYCIESPSNLHYSSDYGNYGTWIIKNGDVSLNIRSERVIGEIYSSWYYHSDDYGSSFNYLNGNGYFGVLRDWDIGTENDYGYILVYKEGIIDSLYLLSTSNNFDDIYQINAFNYYWNDKVSISRGFLGGEVYLLNVDKKEIIFSSNYGYVFETISKLNVGVFTEFEIICGRQDGELFVLYNFANLMSQNAHIYIFHSTDYGKTFELFHPFSKGNQPILANFCFAQTQGVAPFTIEWCNFSIGENVSYEWDFDNNGTIDSNEESPVYNYEEPGIYSVKLSVVGSDSTNSFTKENYITVYPFPTQPQDLSAEVIDDDVYLNWQAILPDTTLLGYYVYRDTTLLTPEPITIPNYEDLNLASDTYEYCVEAVYTYAVSEKSCVEASITVGVEEWEKANLMIYPNPADEEIFIHFPGSFQLSIFNSNGEQVFPENDFTQTATIFVGDLPGGIYYIHINSDKRKLTKKIIVR